MSDTHTAPPNEPHTASGSAEHDNKEEDVLKLKGLLVQILILGAPLAIEAIWKWAKSRKKTA